MAFELHTYKTQVCLAYGPWVGLDNQLAQATGYTAGVPDRLWGGDSFEWVVELYEDAAKSDKLDVSSGTCKLYIGKDEDSATLTEIGTGAVSGTGDYIVTYSVAADAIPSACFGETCLLVGTVTTTGKQTTILQRVTVERAYTSAGSSASIYADQATGVGLTAGKVYFWDVSLDPDAWALADPDTAGCDEFELWLATSSTTLVSQGMYAAAVSGADVGDPLYLDDGGVVSHTVPDSGTTRVIGWQRTASYIRFDGHIPVV